MLVCCSYLRCINAFAPLLPSLHSIYIFLLHCQPGSCLSLCSNASLLRPSSFLLLWCTFVPLTLHFGQTIKTDRHEVEANVSEEDTNNQPIPFRLTHWQLDQRTQQAAQRGGLRRLFHRSRARQQPGTYADGYQARRRAARRLNIGRCHQLGAHCGERSFFVASKKTLARVVSPSPSLSLSLSLSPLHPFCFVSDIAARCIRKSKQPNNNNNTTNNNNRPTCGKYSS